MGEYHLTIKSLPEDQRPRERMACAGPQALNNAELLAILLGTGGQRETAVDMAQRILHRGGLRYLAESDLQDLQQIKGLGLAKASQIKAAVELGRRIATTAPEQRSAIRSPGDASRLVMEEMRYLDKEHFRAIALNTKNQVLAIETISVGSLASSIVHPRELFKALIRRSSAAVILVHNHPSGDPTPSREDREITQRLAEGGKLLGIEVLDHVIIGDNRYASLKELGYL
ncbi:RadC family protein [Heliophilum fasciatum]|uniref:DNA replication and repair protein RadC n=1 Tax=Heliophilum fasciatum TaxID=35700 RepID=A0A4R2RV12_9FIRM|nr:DNA repair protein RadC [Heliophilum fasciatum]MCW2277141.1 DNA repair protein RadC [Heliophilum fasciatum]TCP68222.1 DNA replication and repair protein RadC [Heliophilum fasciatum]